MGGEQGAAQRFHAMEVGCSATGLQLRFEYIMLHKSDEAGVDLALQAQQRHMLQGSESGEGAVQGLPVDLGLDDADLLLRLRDELVGDSLAIRDDGIADALNVRLICRPRLAGNAQQETNGALRYTVEEQPGHQVREFLDRRGEMRVAGYISQSIEARLVEARGQGLKLMLQSNLGEASAGEAEIAHHLGLARQLTLEFKAHDTHPRAMVNIDGPGIGVDGTKDY